MTGDELLKGIVAWIHGDPEPESGPARDVRFPPIAHRTAANRLTIEMYIQPANPDCDANNNYRYLLGKGNLADGSYTIVLEEGPALQARVNVGGVQQSVVSPGLPIGDALKVVDGKVKIPDEPGWGVKINPAWIAKANYLKSEKSG